MKDELLAEYASSVLAKIKPSNLFTVSNHCYDVGGLVDAWNRDLNDLGIYFKTVSVRANRVSILVYRKDCLLECINNLDNKCFLRECGYEPKSLDACIECMVKRLALKDFPHEIGLLLGYPYEDVMGFIENGGKNYIYAGYWKVYKNEIEKKEIFNLYNITRLEFKRALLNGADIRSLIAV